MFESVSTEKIEYSDPWSLSFERRLSMLRTGETRIAYFYDRLSRGGVKEPGMGGVMAPAEPGVKRGFERFQGCGFLPFLATAF
ncbi:hypothetical protein [Burkholderia cenocepacia]|uniref:hypothetical protein n=1 Tax=Burkholderia cenocepacia TaxID=95486 RepID=UPI00158D3A27|nr:hypothetical protein [Burkholderia cenocepacia]